jgi:hypothetical protein
MLWETPDDASAEFFEHFYGSLVDGATISDAMVWAWNKTSEGYLDVVDWGLFLLLGDPTARPAGQATDPRRAGNAAGPG